MQQNKVKKILLIVMEPTDWQPGEPVPEGYQLSIDEPTGRFVLTGTSRKIYESSFAYDDRLPDMEAACARAAVVAVKEALDECFQ